MGSLGPDDQSHHKAVPLMSSEQSPTSATSTDTVIKADTHTSDPVGTQVDVNGGIEHQHVAPQPHSPSDHAGTSARSHTTKLKSRTHGKSSQGGSGSWAPLQLAAVVAATGSVWLLRCILKRLSSTNKDQTPSASTPVAPQAEVVQPAEEEEEPEPEEIVDPDTFDVLVTDLLISPPPLPVPGSPQSFNPLASTRPLKDLRFIVSEECSVEGFAPTLGTPLPVTSSTDAPSTSPPSAQDSEAADSDTEVIVLPQPQQVQHSSAPAVLKLLSAGATCIGRSGIQLGDLVGANFGNPFNKGHISGGGCTGAAAAVACGVAHFALATDFLGEAVVPAAYCGLYCYRGTLGMVANNSSLRREGAGLSGAVSLMASDPAILMKAAQALGSPGDPNIKGELMKFVVAEDLFNLCNIEFQPASLAVKRAILRWAGSDQAGAVQLVKFLADNSGAWQQIDVSPTPHPMMPRGLDAFRTAALLLRADELRTRAQLLGYISPPKPKPTPTSTTSAAILPAIQTESAAASSSATVESPADGAVINASAVAAASEEAAVPTDVSPSTSELLPSSDSASKEAPSTTSQQEQDSSSAIDADAESQSAAADVESTSTVAGTTPIVADAAVTEEVEGLIVSRRGDAVDAPESSAAEQQEGQGTEGVLVAEGTAEASAEEVVAESEVEPDWLPEEPDAAQLAVARTIAKQLLDTLRTTVKPDTFMVIPIVPCAAFKRGMGTAAQQQFSVLAQALSCLPALAQCPSVVVPLGTVADGTPLSVAIFGVHKFDNRLLSVVQRMAPYMQEAFEGIKQGFLDTAIANQQRQQAAVEAAAAEAVSKASAAAAAAAAKTSKPSQEAGQPPAASKVDLKRAERAEKFKAKGTEFFNVGQFAKAFDEYTRAINENPTNHVYYNNRAMACLKIFRFEQAEDDCCKALSFGLEEPMKVKALLRRATARTALQKYSDAEADLRAVIAMQPNHRQAREDITNLRIMKAEMSAAEQRAAAEYRSAAMQQQAGGSGGMAGGFDMGFQGPGGAAMNGQGPDLSKMSPLQMQQFMQQTMARSGGM